jgi:hypothetical protein
MRVEDMMVIPIYKRSKRCFKCRSIEGITDEDVAEAGR